MAPKRRRPTTEQPAARRRTAEAPLLSDEIHGKLLKLLRAKSLGDEGVELAKEGQHAPEIRKAVERFARERSPFLWIEAEDPDAPVKWVDGLQGPAKATALLLREEQLSWAVKKHLEVATVENLRVCLEAVVAKAARNGDTGAELKEPHLVAAAETALLEALGDLPACPRAGLKEKLGPLWPEALKALWHFGHGGRQYVASRFRGMMDTAFRRHLQRDPASFFALPRFDLAGTAEQVAVATQVFDHLRRRGWSVLAGCGGAGKSFVLGQLAQAFAATTVPNEHGQSAKCPLCTAPFNQRCACGFVRVAAARRPVRVLLAAPTNRAVAVLQRLATAAGCDAVVCCTLHALGHLRHEALVDVLVVDEASMLASEHGDLIVRCAAVRRAALLLVGDELQLPPVGAGELFRPLLHEAGLPSLVTNLRARGPLQGPIDAIRRGQAAEALPFGVRVGKDAERHEAMRAAWAAGAKGAVQVLCLRNEERINFCCYAVRLHHDAPEDDYAAGKSDPFFFKPFVGEPVRFQKNTYKPQACRGSLGVVAEVKETLERDEARQTARKSYELVVEVLPSGTHVTVRSSARALPFELRPAFAITVHDAQGGEFDHVHVVMPPSERSLLCTLEMLYTAVSRARQSLTLWCLQRELATFLNSLCHTSPLRATPFKSMLRAAAGVAARTSLPAQRVLHSGERLGLLQPS